MGGRALLVLLAGITAISARFFAQSTSVTGDMSQTVDRDYLAKSAMNIAQTGVNMGIRSILDNPGWRSGFPIMDLFDGKVTVRVVDTTYLGDDAILVQATGTVLSGTPKQHSETAAAFLYGDYLPDAVLAAITAKHAVTTQGSFVIDGRDHDDDGNVGTTGDGKPAVWTSGAYNQKDGDVGGSWEGTEYTPCKSADTTICREHQSWPCGYPSSPDSVIGKAGKCLRDGTLRAYAQSGVCGSQYATDPTTLRHPLRGVTYVELPSGSSWKGADLTGSGILVVHNETHDCLVQDANRGLFRGLMVCDEIVHINTTVIGAVISLGSSEDDIAGGSGGVLFSKKGVSESVGNMIRHVPSRVAKCSVIAWRE